MHLLVSNPHRLLTKQKILDELWPGLQVSEGLVKEYIHDLRRLLEDEPSDPCFIETVRGRGYRYMDGIEVISSKAASPANPVGHALAGHSRCLLCKAPREPSVAVVPFANLSGDRPNDRRCVIFTQGVTDDLSRFRALAVVSQHSARRCRLGQLTPAEIGRRLGVCYLVAGSIRSAGRRARVALELIETTSQRVPWSDSLIVATGELMDLQHEVSGMVASRLGIQIDADLLQTRLAGSEADEARWLILRSQALVRQFARRANAEAMGLLQRALEVVPNSSRAYRVLSRAHTYDALWLEHDARSVACRCT